MLSATIPRRVAPVTVVAYTAIAGPYAITRTEATCFGSDTIFQRPVMEAKRYKILPHLFLPTAPITIWHDGNIWLQRPAEQLVETFLGTADLAVFCHPYRRTIWQEFQELRRGRGRFAIPWLQQQLRDQEAQYRLDGLPAETPLYECNMLIRRRTEAVNRLMEAWWAQICRWQWRDQVSFPYVLWKYGAGVTLRAHPGLNIRHHPDFRYAPH